MVVGSLQHHAMYTVKARSFYLNDCISNSIKPQNFTNSSSVTLSFSYSEQFSKGTKNNKQLNDIDEMIIDFILLTIHMRISFHKVPCRLLNNRCKRRCSNGSESFQIFQSKHAEQFISF